MRILPITTIQPTNSIAKNSINFEAGWKISGKDILKADSREMRKITAHFHKAPQDTLIEVSTVRNFLGVKRKEDSLNAFNKLKKSINSLIESKNIWKKEITNLKRKKEQGGLSPNQKIELDRLISVVSNLEQKAAACYTEYYEYDTPSESSSDHLDGMNDPVTYRSTHYD